MAGIQSLTILLSISLVISTGVIIGTLSITSGNKATDDAQATGDRGIAECFGSSESTVVSLSNVVLDAILEDVRSRFLSLISAQGRTIDAAVLFLKGRTPDEIQTSYFKNEILSPFCLSALTASAKEGITYIAHIPYGWSKNESLAQNDPEFGSPIAHILANSGSGFIQPGEIHNLMWDTIGPYYPIPDRYSSPYIRYGSSDSRGRLIGDTECRAQPNFTAGETKGYCQFPKVLIEAAAGLDEVGGNLLNANTTGKLEAADQLHYDNIEGSGNDITLRSFYVYTHPEMPNRYPRQDHRVALILVGQSVKIFSDMLKSLDLPVDTHLYCVERNIKTGEIGTLVAVNYGTGLNEYTVSFGGTVYEITKPIHVTEHNTSDGHPSIIREHGAFMVSNSSVGFEETSKLPAFRANSWISSNGTQYWMQVKKITAGSNLVWYVTMLVARDEAMKEIDQAVAAIQLKISSDRSTADDDKKQGFTIMIITVSVSAAILLIIGVVFTTIIIKPLTILQQDMSNIAQMKLDSVDMSREMSSLSEVREMQVSFKQMVSNLIEYRNYMPQSVLIDSSELDETETSLNEDDVHWSRLSQVPSDRASHSALSMSSKDRVLGQNHMLVDTSLKKKNISVIAFNVKGFMAIIKNETEAELHDTHQQVLTAIVSCVTNRKGVCETFSGDRVLATFNAVRPTTTYALSCAQAADAARRAVQDTVQLSFACGSGDARVGNMGIKGMKKFTILSSTVPFIVALEKLNAQYGTLGLIDHYQQDTFLLGVSVQKSLIVTYPKRDSRPITVSEVIEPKDLAEEEWMYQLRSAQTSNKSPWNTAFEALEKSCWGEASEVLAEMTPVFRDHVIFKLMMEAVQEKSMKSLTVTLT